MSSAMAKLSTRDSFIVRVYRYDPEDSRSVTGRIEALDGSGASEPFTDAEKLGLALSSLLATEKRPRHARGRKVMKTGQRSG